jgi:galactoside O-acetyltransferase
MKQGIDVRVSPLAHIVHPELAFLGNHVAIDPFVVITTALEMGNYVHIAPHCTVIGGIHSKLVMGDFTNMAAGSRIVCGSDDYGGEALLCPLVPMKYRKVTFTTVTLQRFTTLGTNVVVHPGVTVGEGTVVGSCSLVTTDLLPWSIYVGVPARRVKERRRDKILEFAERLRAETA